MQRHVFFCLKKSLQKSEKTRNAEVSKYVFQKEVIDRENKRKRWKTHVVETRKQEEKKETTDEPMDELKEDTKR